MKKFFANEMFLGTMIAILSVLTAGVSYLGSMSDSKQNEYEIQGMKDLNDGNAEYLRANQDITQDYNYFDNWYLNVDERPEIADYYQTNFSEALQSAIDTDPETVWIDEYYDAMYADAYSLWDSSDTAFAKASEYDDRGDQLQLVMLIFALGLAFVAWSSLLGAESNMRLLFSIAGFIALAAGIAIYFLLVPVIAG
ncbi:MAG TPA: hypothetical protein PKL78_05745 [Anaerolineales bacterium]|nr:hypothetical protein [Anaerolineales bacterium]HNN13041.1 hypothetical protein [Anaerolineales bacterium]HNO30592.1 hypothetical protein [Anaerolineales bacterium]